MPLLAFKLAAARRAADQPLSQGGSFGSAAQILKSHAPAYSCRVSRFAAASVKPRQTFNLYFGAAREAIAASDPPAEGRRIYPEHL